MQQTSASIDDIMLKLDGTENKAKLGANAILAVSLAAAKAAALAKGMPLYEHIAEMNGTPGRVLHAGADDEHPQWWRARGQQCRYSGVHDPASGRQELSREALRMGAEIFHSLKKVLKCKGLNTAVGDEGGFAPNLPSNEAALQVIQQAVEKAGYTLGKDVTLALDCASSEFYQDGKYDLAGEGKVFSAEEFADYLDDLAQRYPIVSIEDGMDESDWDGWAI